MLDEESFTQLLSAAYVMQEHQRQVTSRVAPADLTQILTQIVETQNQIRSRQLPTSTALELIADRLQRLAGAAGAAVGIRQKEEVHYKAACGTAAFLAGSQMGIRMSLSAECLNSGEVLRIVQARSDKTLDTILRERLHAQSVLAVPVHLEGKIAGTVELYFSEPNAFGEGDVRACELMAGLVTEVLTQALQDELKQELATERASVLMALEKLKPQLQKLASEPEAAEAEAAAKPSQPAATQSPVCRACGNSFIGNETYCGVCGASRVSGRYPGTELQSKWATLWEQQVSRGEVSLDRAPIFRRAAAGASGPQQQHSHEIVDPPFEPWDAPSPALQSADLQAEDEPAPPVQPQQTTSLTRWPSALPEVAEVAEDWPEISEPEPTLFESLLRDHAGDIALGLAGLVLLVALIWGVFAQRSTSGNQNGGTAGAQTRAAKHRQRPKQPQLTLMEQAMVSLGLAEPPPAPVDTGNPDAKVWVDLGTALYYCQGDNLYGTTPKGKYTSQSDAQQDAFQPAYRKVCE